MPKEPQLLTQEEIDNALRGADEGKGESAPNRDDDDA